MKAYRIVDWSRHFENNRTRDLKRMAWVPLPNRMDGDGYTELVDHEDGAAHFGAWVAIVEIASRCEPRGTLIRSPDKAHNSTTLARISRISRALFDAIFPRLLAIGWIEEFALDGADNAEPHVPAGAPQESDYRTERNGTERKEDIGRITEEIYRLYPSKRRANKPSTIRDIGKAIKKYGLTLIRRRAEAYAAAVEPHVETHAKMIPLSSTWWHQERFNDQDSWLTNFDTEHQVRRL